MFTRRSIVRNYDASYDHKTCKNLPFLSFFRVLNSRRTHVYCVGTAKSGTHSIDSIFRDHLRSAHEPQSGRVIKTILKVASGEMSKGALRKFLRKRVLLQIPHIVLDNSYGKVRGFFDLWTHSCELAYWCDAPDEALESAMRLAEQ